MLNRFLSTIIRKNDVILFAALASEKNGDAIDNAIFKVLNGSSKLSSKINEFKIIDFTPFDPVIKRTEAVVERDKRRFRVAKGAPQVIIELCRVSGVDEVVEQLAENGYRSLGVAVKHDNWEFVGVIPLFDPPREDAVDAIRTIRELGISVKMLTRDNTAIAKHIAKLLNLGD